MAAALTSKLTHPPLGELKDIWFYRDYRPIISNLSLHVHPCDCLVLRGANGAGKSTVLQLLAGLLTPQRGQVILNSTYHYLGHNNGLMPHWRGEDLLQSKQASCEIASLLQLDKILTQAVSMLSAGQQRRLALARLLLSPAKLWILDEPTANLDTQTTQRFYEYLHTHCQAGGAVIMASHESIPFSIQELTLHG